MRWLTWLTSGIRNAFRRSRLEREAREEIAFHLEQRARDLEQRGVSSDEARRLARAEFGGVESAVERSREAWGFRVVNEFRQDLRHGARMFARSPGFTVIAVLSVAIGIGVTASIFSIADAILFRPLGIRDPGRVVAVDISRPDELMGAAISYPNYRDLRARAQSFDGLIAYQLATFSFARSREVVPDMRMGMEVSDNFFQVLGVPAALGRLFSADEGRVPDRDAVMILGHDFWQGGLAGDSSVVGRTVWLNGLAFKIIGVAPERFTGMNQYLRPAFFVPATMAHRLGRGDENPIETRTARAFDVRARLKPGVSRQRAQRETEVLWSGLVQEHPKANRHLVPALRTELETRMRVSPEDGRLMVLLLALVALVLAIACANVANLLLGRARGRSREIAIRQALGVSRSRLFRQLLTESALLAAAGCVLGLGLAAATMEPIQIPTDLPIVIAPHLDQRLLMFTLIVTAASVLLFGVAPAWQSLRTQLVPALKRSEPGRPSRHRTPGRNVLVVVQIALSMALLVATGIVFDGFRKSLTMNPGFRTDHLVTMTLDTSLVGRSSAETREFYRDLVDRARVLPGAVSVALTGAVPLDPNGEGESVVPEGHQFPPGQDRLPVFSATVTDRYFATVGTELVQGRDFSTADRETTRPVVIVNEQFAREYWPGQDPIGKRLKLAAADSPWMEVVGVAKTGTYVFLGEPPRPFVYLPLAQHDRSRLSLVVQSATADPTDLIAPLRQLVRNLDPNQPIYNVRSMSTFYEQRALSIRRGMLSTVGAMGAIGVVLALIGLYGLVAYSVACRTREIGIRMAIGAARSDVLKMVLRQGMSLSMTGVVCGGLGSVLLVGMLSAGLPGLGEPGWRSYVVLPLLLIGLTVAASYIPARRASRVDPLLAVRDE